MPVLKLYTTHVLVVAAQAQAAQGGAGKGGGEASREVGEHGES